MATTSKCTEGARHKWEWVKDVTNISVTVDSRGTRKKLSRRGIYKCECGASKEGQPRTGL